MATRAGVGYTENPKSRQAGVEVATAALADAGIDRCDLAIMYATPKHDPAQLRDGVRSVIGPAARLIGGYSMGIITRDRLGYDGFQVGLAVLSSDSMKVDMFIEKGLPNNEHSVGVALGKQIRSKRYAGEPNILLMYDSVKERTSEGVALNLATPLIEGVGQSLQAWPRAAGVGMLGDLQCNPTYQWFDDRVEQGGAMALVLSGGVRLDTIIMHGCKPSSGYHTITKAEGNVVLEIDGRPAVDAIAALLGPDSDRSWEDYPMFVTLGVNKGEKFGEFKEEEYANRLVMAVDRERGGLIMFENDLKTGFEVQLMRRSLDFAYIRTRAQELLDRVGDRTPVFALYIDCAGRASAYCGMEGEEAEEVQKVIGGVMPLLGMYSGVEIAKVGQNMQALDWTGVLCVLSE
ncbi:MAG: FIST C-terminal domain-containing protein [Candidatus Rokubacteria bacterium]|nr:FIST C-terminal domain-containing protein [Candidatus Rokubacteria bacterium]